jgi:two-component system sensor histidine kinase TctE
MTPLDLGALAREVASDFVPRAMDASIDLGASPDTASASIRGNAVLIRELLGNLLDNALRYTPAGGHVTVKVEQRDAEVELSVEDDGPGILPEHRARVFDRFQRLGANDPFGCGLGLAIVREIADLHAATVHLGNPDGHPGTRVGVVFPALAPEAEKAA